MTADYRNPAGHKFTEVITARAQHPEFRGSKARIMFGHGHPAGTDVAGNINFTLSHGIGATIARITVNDDLRAGIEPAHII